MKITNIEQEGDFFIVTFSPKYRICKKIFQLKEKKVKYKKLSYVYSNYNYLIAFRREDGKLMGAMTKVVEMLNRHIKKF